MIDWVVYREYLEGMGLFGKGGVYWKVSKKVVEGAL
jgi:hypothetical protein